MRLLASLHHYLATVTDDGIQLPQYASSTIRAGDVVLSVETAYPRTGRDGTVRVEVVESPDREWTLAAQVVLLEVIGPPLQRVHVEEPRSTRGGCARESVVQDAFHVVRVPGIAGGQQQPPGPLKARDGRARLVVSTVVSTVRRQLEPVTKLSPSCRDLFPPVRYVFAATMSAQRPTEVCSSAASPVSAGTSTTPASRYSARTTCPTSVLARRTGSWS
jgi:hypothetical protein